MGYGDEIIVTGQARTLFLKNGRKVMVVDRYNRPRTHDLWANNPRIRNTFEPTSEPLQRLQNGPGLRPYIKDKTEKQWQWRDWECPVGELYFAKSELQTADVLGSPCVVIEPFIKRKASPNKSWGRARWDRLGELMLRAGIEYYQLGPRDTPLISGARLIETQTFRIACTVLAKAKAAVLHEGGLHHAAAALGVPSVVLFGGFIGPQQTGYALHTNLFTGGEPCGMRIPCDHCERAMSLIEPEMVFDSLVKILRAS